MPGHSHHENRGPSSPILAAFLCLAVACFGLACGETQAPSGAQADAGPGAPITDAADGALAKDGADDPIGDIIGRDDAIPDRTLGDSGASDIGVTDVAFADIRNGDGMAGDANPVDSAAGDVSPRDGVAGDAPVAGDGGPSGDRSWFPPVAGRYAGTFTAPPRLIDTDQTTDAPLLGNGDLGVAVLNNLDTMTFILHKNEFWSLSEKRVQAMARLSLAIPAMAGATYAMSQALGAAEVTGSFTLGGNTIATTSWVQADDTTNNRLFTQFRSTGSASTIVTVALGVGSGNAYASVVGSAGDVLYLDVRADGTDTVGGYDSARVRVAVRVVGAVGTVAANKLSFTLAPGQTVTLSTSVMSNFDGADFKTKAVSNVSTQVAADIAAHAAAHHAFWDAFYGKSFVEISDKLIEKQYYAALYLLASASRAGEAAPGLWGNWVMKAPAWNGDYTLNYNYEAPFYLAFPTNHLELADSYDKPIVDWLPKAKAQATTNGFTGAYYRVHIGPLPDGSSDQNEWNQKSCGAFAATDMLMHYYYTRDPAYAMRVYETLKELGTFWQDYLKVDGTRYVIYEDAQHEGDVYPQTNGIMSLGLVRFLLRGCIDISTELGVDVAARAIWQDRLDKLSAFPTFTMSGKTVFRYTEVGRDWNTGNAIGVQHIYPASQIGLASPPDLLSTAKNMIDVMARWEDDNGTNTFYPAAARIGHDPADILTHLHTWIQNHTYPNLHIHTGGGGIENFNTVPSTIAELLLQSFQDRIRVFANWPPGNSAHFGDLRAYGAFLVSSDIRNNVVQFVRLISERGRPFTVVNPWPGQTVRLYRNGVDAGTVTGPEISLPSSVNEVIHFAPDGVTYDTILARMRLPL